MRAVVPAFVLLAAACHGGVDEIVTSCPTPAEVAAIDAALDLSFESDQPGAELVCSAAAGSVDPRTRRSGRTTR
jgi:hypothetical protein